MRSKMMVERVASLLVVMATLCAAHAAGAQPDSATRAADPRVGLRAGWKDAGEAIRNMALIGHSDRPDRFFVPTDLGNFSFMNSDLAFKGNYVYQGNFNGFQIWDISNVKNPVLKTSYVCPGGQGDLSVYGKLLFMSVEETRGRLDCGGQGVADTVSAERFRGVRIFDMTDMNNPKQVGAVQTCRGSHTHTLVIDPKDKANVYIYVSGTAGVRSPNELAGCSPKRPEDDPNSSLFRIEVIRVPLAAPQNAKIVNTPRVFADSATGAIAGLNKGGTHGEGTQTTSETNRCHDITAYSDIGLAAGACAGNGILMDIRNPAKPRRVAEVSDPNFAFWHSATFSNDGKKVLFTDEWGGGTNPRCRWTDKLEWGADALFTIDKNHMTPAGYYKMPAPQTTAENCVAHNGSIIPVPGRDIMAQGWYQGGISVFDFTDPAHVKEIAYYDRGPMDSTKLVMAGSWGAYWYNGHIISSEIGRGLDIFDLKPSEYLSQNEIDAAKLVHFETVNPQNQQRQRWPASFVLSRAYVDQISRMADPAKSHVANVAKELDRIEKLKGDAQRDALTKLAATLERDAKGSTDPRKELALSASLNELANAKR